MTKGFAIVDNNNNFVTGVSNDGKVLWSSNIDNAHLYETAGLAKMYSGAIRRDTKRSLNVVKVTELDGFLSTESDIDDGITTCK